jgi:hypothetical protein
MAKEVSVFAVLYLLKYNKWNDLIFVVDNCLLAKSKTNSLFILKFILKQEDMLSSKIV